MFCGNAAGELLPPMVIYKAKFVYDGWVNDGPTGSVFDSTDSGWFDGHTFKKWFMEVFVPNLKGDGPFAIIGGNFGSHSNDEVINICLERNIRFITLVPNSTHLFQPLDLAVFGPMKRSWRSLLNEWREESRSKGTLPKQHFLLLLRCLLHDIKADNLVSGFRGSGIPPHPLNKDEVIHRMSSSNEQLNESVEQLLGGSIVRVLQENLGIGREQVRKASRKRGKKITPGQAITTLQNHQNKENAEAIPDPFIDQGIVVYQDRDSEEIDREVVHCRKPTARKRLLKESKGKKFRNRLNTWACRDCEEEWDDNDPHMWVECDTCGNKHHLKCSGIRYKTKDYWKINLDSFQFECKEMFDGC